MGWCAGGGDGDDVTSGASWRRRRSRFRSFSAAAYRSSGFRLRFSGSSHMSTSVNFNHRVVSLIRLVLILV